VVLFGGYDPATGLATPGAGDTWAFDGTSWTQISTPTSPPARAVASMATLGDRIVLYGGMQASSGGLSPLGDTWTFDGTTWTQATPATSPVIAGYAGIAPLGNELVMFGGYWYVDTNQTWTFDGTSWTSLPIAIPPTARDGSGMATSGNQIVMFGGSMGTDQGCLGDTWTFDGKNWTLLPEVNGLYARAYTAMTSLP
jgi:hypothetical protein